jgi:methionyl-tRNA synthetase
VPVHGVFSPEDEAMLALGDALPGKARAAFGDYALHTILAEIWAVVAEANRYFAAQEPWKLTKTDPARRDTVLYVTAETLRAIGLMAQPFIPASAQKLLDLLGVEAAHRQFDHVGARHRLRSGTALPAPAPIFPRYVEPETAGEGA